MKSRFLVGIFCLLFAHTSAAIQTQHLPDGFCPEIIDYSHYSLCYEPEHRQASWVKYKLTQESVNGKQKRTNNYRKDPLVDDPVLRTDYRGSGFDRGHLLPAADMKLNYQAMSETFFMTNMSPQRANFNRGIWASIERRLRTLVKQHGEAHVITGGVLVSGLPKIDSGVSVPDLYYKVAYFPGPQMMKAYLIGNQGVNKGMYYGHFLVTVNEVEDVTGFDFFSQLPDVVESELENKVFRQ